MSLLRRVEGEGNAPIMIKGAYAPGRRQKTTKNRLPAEVDLPASGFDWDTIMNAMFRWLRLFTR